MTLDRLEALYGRLLSALAWLACLLVFAMTLMICLDVLLRNVALIPSMRGLDWSNDVTEAMLRRDGTWFELRPFVNGLIERVR